MGDPLQDVMDVKVTEDWKMMNCVNISVRFIIHLALREDMFDVVEPFWCIAEMKGRQFNHEISTTIVMSHEQPAKESFVVFQLIM